MNQEQNNLNLNNFNTQGDNEIPNNQLFTSMNQEINDTFNQNMQQNINVNQQQPMQNQSTTNMYSQPQQLVQPTMNTYQRPVQPQQPKKKVNTKMIIIIAVIVAVVIAGIIFIPKLFGNKGKQNVSDSLTESTSFWISNKEGLYAMFDINGKQLTGFDFTSVSSEFVNGTAEVRNENDEYGLISSTGKMVVEFGKYNYIFEEEAVYEMIDKDHNHFLYSSSGMFVRQLDDEKNEEIESFVNEYTYALIKSDYYYKVIDYNGKEITTIAIPEDDDDINSPKASSRENYVSIFYNNVNYIIDISKGKALLTIPDTRHFCIGDVNEENPEEFILSTCNAPYGVKQKNGSKLVRNGKVAYSKESDYYYDSMKFEGNNVVYGDSYLLDENGSKKISINGYINYKDYKNYIRKADGISNGSELYVNGSLKEKLDCNTIQGGYARHGVYLLDSCSGFGYENDSKIYINADGTRINDKSYQRAYEFDENGYASVSEDGKNFYLINLKGEKVSDYYIDDRSAEKIYNIHETKNLYYGTNEDGTETVFEVNGKKLLTGKIIWSTSTTTAVGKFIVAEKDNKYVVYNLSDDKENVTLNSKPDMSENYFTTSENSKTQYYSYTTGKIFYER